jgi:predicted thioesterase
VNVEVGLRGVASLVVSEADTAVALRSGSVAVLGTPRLVALFEEATVAALDSRVADGQTTVGMRVQIDHLQPTAVGGRVIAEAVLERIEGRRLTFTVTASDERSLVAAGKVTRVVVEIARFLSKSE